MRNVEIAPDIWGVRRWAKGEYDIHNPFWNDSLDDGAGWQYMFNTRKEAQAFLDDAIERGVLAKERTGKLYQNQVITADD